MMTRGWDARLDALLPNRSIEQLVALFPLVAPADLQLVPGFIRQLLAEGQPVVSGDPPPPASFLSPAAQLVSWRGARLALPYRVCFPEPAAVQLRALPTRPRQVLHCLYLRHCDGFVRQRHLEALLSEASLPDFAVPFLFSLLGEYVKEILDVLAQHLTPVLRRQYAELIAENPLYWQKMQGRVASYWDIYYRRGEPRFPYYVGARLLAQLRQAVRQAAENGHPATSPNTR